MAKIAEQPVVSVTAHFTVTESELRALEALTGYGTDQFLEFFYKNMGTTYMKPHEAGLREFFSSIRNIACPIIKRADAARAVFAKDHIK
ncbi:hypothetical protein D3C87_1472720 [compost metagenome]